MAKFEDEFGAALKSMVIEACLWPGIAAAVVILCLAFTLYHTLKPIADRQRRERCREQEICIECGYSLHGLNSNRCPECGTAFEPLADD